MFTVFYVIFMLQPPSSSAPFKAPATKRPVKKPLFGVSASSGTASAAAVSSAEQTSSAGTSSREESTVSSAFEAALEDSDEEELRRDPSYAPASSRELFCVLPLKSSVLLHCLLCWTFYVWYAKIITELWRNSYAWDHLYHKIYLKFITHTPAKILILNSNIV